MGWRILFVGKGGVKSSLREFKGDCRELITNALSMRGNHEYNMRGAEKFNRDPTKILQPPMGDK